MLQRGAQSSQSRSPSGQFWPQGPPLPLRKLYSQRKRSAGSSASGCSKKRGKAGAHSEKRNKKGQTCGANALENIAESLGAIASSSKASQQPSKFAVSLPTAIEIQSTKEEEQRPGYGEVVSAILQERLDLPEFGEVVAKIEIAPNGTVASVEILEAKSRKNGSFLKKRLQELAFPCFNEFGLSESGCILPLPFTMLKIVSVSRKLQNSIRAQIALASPIRFFALRSEFCNSLFCLPSFYPVRTWKSALRPARM